MSEPTVEESLRSIVDETGSSNVSIGLQSEPLELARQGKAAQVKGNDMITKLFCCALALIIMGGVVATAAEPVGIEIRKRNSIGRLGLTGIQATVKTEADGTMVVSFQAPGEGTYVLIYATGPNKGKTAMRINVSKPGPVTTKVKGGSH